MKSKNDIIIERNKAIIEWNNRNNDFESAKRFYGSRSRSAEVCLMGLIHQECYIDGLNFALEIETNGGKRFEPINIESVE